MAKVVRILSEPRHYLLGIVLRSYLPTKNYLQLRRVQCASYLLQLGLHVVIVSQIYEKLNVAPRFIAPPYNERIFFYFSTNKIQPSVRSTRSRIRMSECLAITVVEKK